MIQHIIEVHASNKKYEKTLKSYGELKTRKEPQCPYRLMNMLFSDEFAEQFALLGNVANRVLLDLGKAANYEHFWKSVQEAFALQEETYDKILFKEDDVFCNLDNIDPSKIVAHD